MVCNHPNRSCDHRFCNGGNITFLISHVTSYEQMFKGLCEFTGESHHLAIFGAHWSSAMEILMSHDLTKPGSYNFISENSSWYITTMQCNQISSNLLMCKLF